MVHPPGEDELHYHDWYEDRDKARAAIFAYAKANLRWGSARRIPATYLSPDLQCDMCDRPRAQATYVSWYVLYCDRHLRARNRKLTKTLKWREKVREMERLARDHETIFKGL